MNSLPFLNDFLIILAAAVLIIFVSRPLRLPSVVGFLLTGLLIGPSGLNFIQDRHQVEVFAISDPYATRTGARLARSLNSKLYVIVRTRLVSEVDELEKSGANEVIPEEFETSIEIFTRVLEQYRIPRNVVNAQIKVIRDENCSMLGGLPQTSRGLERVAQLLVCCSLNNLNKW